MNVDRGLVLVLLEDDVLGRGLVDAVFFGPGRQPMEGAVPLLRRPSSARRAIRVVAG